MRALPLFRARAAVDARARASRPTLGRSGDGRRRPPAPPPAAPPQLCDEEEGTGLFQYFIKLVPTVFKVGRRGGRREDETAPSVHLAIWGV